VRVQVWGCRGSLASPGPSTVRYGGNTSCVSVTLLDGTIIVLDAGSGIRDLGRSIGPRLDRPVHLLLSHLHLDHLQGLGFFGPIWDADTELHIWGPSSMTQTLAERIATYLSPPLFPIHLSDVPAQLHFHQVGDEPFVILGATIDGQLVSHQGPTLGYRIEEQGRVVAYIPDHEPSLGVDITGLDVSWLSGYELAENADLLFHDAQYDDDEYGAHIGWGHSAISHVVTIGRRSNTRQLVLFHHDPAHSDDDLERILAVAVELWGNAPNPPVLAYEGMDITLAPLDAPAAVVD
jgi:phosphoribosyl 1,2-cyclic phosphodiesterase